MAQRRDRRWVLAALIALAAGLLAVGLGLRSTPLPTRPVAPPAPRPQADEAPAKLPVPIAEAPADRPTGPLRLFVTDTARAPLVGARVRLIATEPFLELEAFCDDAGEALLEAPLSGDVELLAEAAGFASARQLVRLPAALPVRMALEREASLEVTVTDASGRPIPGVEVAWRASERRPRREETTGEDGRALLEALAPGPGQLDLEPMEQLPASQRLVLAPGERRVLAVQLEPGAAITGVVLDPAGRPVGGAYVDARSPAPPEASLALARTEADGRFRLPGLTAGAVVLEAEADGFGIARVPVQAPAEVTLQLPKAAAVFGELRGPDGAIPSRGQVNGRPVEEGRFLVDDLQPGPLELTFSADGLAPSRRSITLAPGEARDLGTVTLSSGHTLTLVTLDAEGRPCACELELRADAAGVFLGERSDEQGLHDFPQLPSGRYVVSARAEGRGRASATVELAERDVRLVLTLEGGVRVDGTVIGPDGAPLSSGHVVLLARDRGVEHGSAELDATGRFAIQDVPVGPAIALVEDPDGSHLQPIDVPAGGLTLLLDLRPKPGAATTVELRLLDAASHPVERGAALLLPGAHSLPTDGPGLLQLLATPDARPFEWRAADGRLVLPAIPPGSYTLLFLLDGRAHDVGLVWAEPLVVPATGPLRRVVRLPADLPSLDLETLRGSAP